MSFNYKKIFLTGATGWLGRQFLQTLIKKDSKWLNSESYQNYEIFCLINEKLHTKDQRLFSKVKTITGDIRNIDNCEEFLEQIDSDSLLVHTAGVIHPNRIKDFYEINVLGTKNIIEAALRKSTKKIIAISSNSPYGCNVNKIPFNEESPYNPYMEYGNSKMQMEIILNENMNSNTDISIICVPWFYGKGMPKRQIEFYKMIINGIFPLIGDGENLRSIVNIENIIQGVLLCSIVPESRNKKYWIADEQNLSMLEIVETIRSVFKNEFAIPAKMPFIKTPSFIGQIAETLDKTFQNIGIYNQKIHVLSEMNKDIFCEIKKAKRELGYNPEYDLYRGTLEAYKDYLKRERNV